MKNEAITAVNNWRGHCLDNFARVEKVVVDAFSANCLKNLSKPPILHETAAQRTRNLSTALRQNWPKDPVARKAASRLEGWGLRETERNELVHGCFIVKGAGSNDWSFVNETIVIKKGVPQSRKVKRSKIEAEAFLQAIIEERKELEAALRSLKTLGD